MTDRSRSFLLLINPHAAGGRARDRIPAVTAALREAGGSFETEMTRGPGHATALVREALQSGVAGVAVMGGDGTLHEATNGFFDEGRAIAPDAWLGVLSCGTGGDFRRTVGVSGDIAAQVTRMTWASPRPIDVGFVRFRGRDGRSQARAFLNVGSFGIGGEVSQRVNRGLKAIGGTSAFFVGALRAVSEYRSRRIRLALDGEAEEDREILNVAVANGQFFGGGMHIAPRASLEDGLFDVVTIDRRPFLSHARLVPHLYRGTLLDAPGVRFARARQIRAEPSDWAGPITLDLDGETPGTLPATFELRPGALRLKG